MKKWGLALLFLSVFSEKSYAVADIIIDGVSYQIISFANKTVRIGWYENIDKGYSFGTCVPTNTEGDFYIPSTIQPQYYSGTWTVIEISKSAFRNCSSIRNIYIPNTITNIEVNAFQNCSSLESITIPESVTSIGSGAFSGCTSLEKVKLKCPNVGTWFRYNGTIKQVVLEDGVVSVGSNAFGGCSKLDKIHFSETVETIGGGAFSGSKISVLEIPNSVTTINQAAFSGCNLLTTIILGGNVSTLGGSVFNNNSSLRRVYVKNKAPSSIWENNFWTSNGNGFSVSANITLYVPYGYKEIYQGLSGWSAFSNIEECGEPLIAPIKNGEKDIIVEFTIEGGDSEMNGLFLTSLSDASGVLYIPTSILDKDNKELPIIGIKDDAFKNNTNLEGVIIPNTIKAIGTAFSGCNNLRSVIVTNRKPETIEVKTETFYGISDEAVLYVPAGTKERYEAIDAWKVFSQIIESSPISTGDISARYGSKADLPIYLRNTESISGLQFKLTLPEGVTVVDHESNLVTSTTERTEGFTIMGRKDPDEENSYLFVVLSLNGDAISGTEGAFMNVRLDIAQNVGLGVHDIKIEDVYMTTETFDTLNPAESTSELTVKDFMLGDVNNDGIINITDAIGIINYVLKNTPETFIEGAADVNQDGIINVTDAIGVINKILN